LALTAELREFAAELFAGLGPLTFKPMFSGGAVSVHGRTFALILQGELWIKVDAETDARFAETGSPRFSYGRKDGRVVDVAYRRLPETALDDPDEALAWARLGLQAADRAAARKKPRKKAAGRV
jgi:DNA transformation protein and related proteins